MSLDSADQHDEDKLERWRDALSSESQNDFPIRALFLVSERDQGAHDIFREFRSHFEESGAGFQHLVILGQHGVSRSEIGLLSSLNLSLDSIPCLIVLSTGNPMLFDKIALPPGPSSIQSDEESFKPWFDVITGIKSQGQRGQLDVIGSGDLFDGSVEELLDVILADLKSGEHNSFD